MSTKKTYTLAEAKVSGIHTLEIAAAILESLTSELADKSIAVVADGIATKATPGGDDVQFPAIPVAVSEGMPMQQASRMHRFGVRLEPTTMFQADQTQGILYAISQKVRKWVAKSTLTVTTGEFKSMIFLSPPRRDDLDHFQVMEFDLAVDLLLPAED